MARFGQLISILFVSFVLQSVASAEDLKTEVFSIKQNLHKVAIKPGVKADDAIEAMKSKAADMNMKLVGHQPISRELAARGVKSGRLEILQFCNPYDARTMVLSNPLFAAYMPCRIAVVEDSDKKMWLLMLDLDVLINDHPLPLAVKKTAMRINEGMKTILKAGVTGEF